MYDDAFECIGTAIAIATSIDVNASTTVEADVFLCRILLHVHAFRMLLHVHAFVWQAHATLLQPLSPHPLSVLLVPSQL